MISQELKTMIAQELKSEFEKAMTAIRHLSDDLRVRIHLGGLDAKKQWQELEPKIESTLKKAGDEVSQASCRAARELQSTLEKLRSSLH
jgi:hypothetical protein